MSILSCPYICTTYLQIQLPGDVVEQNLAEVATVGEMVGKVYLAPEGYVATELVPSSETSLDRLLQSLGTNHNQRYAHIGGRRTYLIEAVESLDLVLDRVERGLLPVQLCSDLFNRGPLTLLTLLERRLDSFEVTLNNVGLARVGDTFTIVRSLLSPDLRHR